MPHNFWMINCNEQNYNITRNLGFSKQGLKAEYRRKVQRVEPGDRIIYYVTGSRVFTATATVTRGYEEVKSAPWVKEGKTAWPYRIGIRPNVVLNQDQYIEAGLVAYRLEYVRKWPPEDWYMAFQGNLHLLSKSDFFLLESEMLKLRDGRDQALLQIDAEIAEEEGRLSTQRERRRRSTSRSNVRPTRPGNEERQATPAQLPASEPAELQSSEPVRSPEPVQSSEPVRSSESVQSSEDGPRSSARPRRNNRRRSGNRQGPVKPPPSYDNG